jgi:Cof subfamily protein (haloacid dehalogenase superfamily)
MTHLQKDLDIEKHPLVAYNGGLILVNSKVVQSTFIPYSIVEDIITINKDNLHLSLYHEDSWYAPKMDFWTEREINNTKVDASITPNEFVLDLWRAQNIGAHKIMCMGEAALVDKFYHNLKNKFQNQLHLYRSKDTYIEIAPKDISKKSAIEYLINNIFDINFEDVISFGDNYNDIEMLEACGLGIAVGNAKEEVKLAANETIGHAKQDGVAHFLSHYFKS